MKTIRFDEANVAGAVSVDAGLIMIGDPCYHLHHTVGADKVYDRLPRSLGKNWSEFCDKLYPQVYKTGAPEGAKKLLPVVNFEHDGGIPRLAVVLANFGGDGYYPVYVTTDDNGHIQQAVIDFVAD